MRSTLLLAVLLLSVVLGAAGCKDSEATCNGNPLPAGTATVCQPGPQCVACYSCLTSGATTAWTLLPSTCDAGTGADAR